MEFRGMKYVEACVWLAAQINFDIPISDQLPAARSTAAPILSSPATTEVRSVQDTSFRDEQLRASGITEEAQECVITTDGKEIVISRYSAGSFDHRYLPVAGHDMLLHYFDLDGQPIMYEPKFSKVLKPYIRIRHKFPNTHTDQAGKEIRYMSPPGSKNHLWLPEYIIHAFQVKEHIDTLVFVEGEKKADALCLAGIPAVGIAGIFNFAKDGDMPGLVERLITGCSIVNVVFWFDSDLDSLGTDITKDTDLRPRNFALAAIKFRAYFYKLQRSHVNIQAWICHGIDTSVKGADDLLLSLSTDLTPAHPLAKDFTAALDHHTSEGTHVRLHNVTSMSDAQMYELWHLHSPRAFMIHHKEQLKAMPEFRYKKHRYTWDEETGWFKSCQKLLSDEQYWQMIDTKFGPKLFFDFLNIIIFLQRRGFWRQRLTGGKHRVIRVDENIVNEVYQDDIQEFVYDFTSQIEELKVLRMLMQGNATYFGPEKLRNLSFYQPPFMTPSRASQVLCFRDTFWFITEKDITVHKHVELPGAVWRGDVIDFNPTKIDDFITIEEGFHPQCPLRVVFAVDDSDWCKYISATSDLHWRDKRDTETSFPSTGEEMEEKDWIRMHTLMTCMMDKIIATGHTVSNFMDPAEMKAVICMDAQESKSGKSEGGTGKSLFAGQFEYLFPVHRINGKQKDMTLDRFLYDGVDERTRLILVDDCRRTMDFEGFFSYITSGLIAENKGVGKKPVGLKRWVFTTNFSIRGEDRSHLRRQYNLAFSDYFSTDRDPFKVFGHSLFYEWDDKQWNYWYNFIAYSIQQRMRHGLKTFANEEDIKRRKLRDMISETWLDFFESYFYTGSEYINKRFEIEHFLSAFKRNNESQKNYAVKVVFKEKADQFCRYAGFQYNFPRNGDRIRNAGKKQEFFVISDHEFDINKYELVIEESRIDASLTPEF